MDPSYNSFGSFGSGGTSGGQPGTIASAPQAVVTSAPKKKSYRWLIAVVILLLIGVGVGVGVFVLMKGGVVGAGENGFEKSFNIYANFLLYGEDSDAPMEDFMGLNYVYYFDKEDVNIALDREEIESIGNYYAELSRRLDDFLKNVDSSNLPEEDKKAVADYSEMANGYFEVRSKYFLNSDDIIQYFIVNGYDDTSNFVNNYYDSMSADSEAVENLRGFLKESADYYLNEFNAYSVLGCVNGAAIDYNCGVGVAVFDYDTTIIELEAAIETIVDNMRNGVLEGYWEIYNEIIK